MTKKRSYRLNKRADAQDETRQRIVEATMALHEEIGPRATTISAIAERAGVQRLTVYRHFPDETAVFQACTSHWLELNPPPQPSQWAAVEDPVARARTAISAFFGYYASTQRMWRVAFRDVDEVEALHEPMVEVARFMSGVVDGLYAGFPSAQRTRELKATLTHVLDFRTFDQLREQGLSVQKAVSLATTWFLAQL